MSRLYSISGKQNIPIYLDQAWDYISSPENLKEITPENFNFQIISKKPAEKMHKGMIIEYKVSPVLGIKMKWVSEITAIEEKKFFIDEQRKGPFSYWHHQHLLKEINGGVEMTDIIHYRLPFGFIGDIAQIIIVKKQIKDLFDYRFKKLEDKFGKYQNYHNLKS
jgi:ligand-binding SRPBCC domain-containing protein